MVGWVIGNNFIVLNVVVKRLYVVYTDGFSFM